MGNSILLFTLLIIVSSVLCEEVVNDKVHPEHAVEGVGHVEHLNQKHVHFQEQGLQRRQDHFKSFKSLFSSTTALARQSIEVGNNFNKKKQQHKIKL